MTIDIRIFCRILVMVFFLTNMNMWSQKLELVTKLPSIINESSGIETAGLNRFWTFNDSGGKPALYLIDTLGNLLKTLKINKSWNRDWEDITKDSQGNVYIGNIGNNSNATKDLTIFKIPNPSSINGDSISAEIISFSFEDQTLFPPSSENKNFDCEAMFWFNKNIYLFTKNRSFPTATNLYRIPDEKGNYIAKKISTFYTGKNTGVPNDYGSHWVTAAAISPDGTRICLVNENKLWVFYEFTKDHFFDGKFIEINLGSRTQKEAACFLTNDEIYITDEYWLNSDSGGNLYKIKLESFLKK